MDFSSLLPAYPSLEEAEGAIRACAKKAGYSLKKAGSKTDSQKRVRKLRLVCAHSGTPRKRDTKVRMTSSRLLDCKWYAQLLRIEGLQWTIKIINNTHTHDPSATLSEIPAERVRTTEQDATILAMDRGGALPRVILSTIKAADPSNLTTAQDIYNIKKRKHNDILQGRTSLEALLDTLQTTNVFHRYVQNNQGGLLRLFFAPTLCVSAAKEFGITDVILMDSTYNTNR